MEDIDIVKDSLPQKSTFAILKEFKNRTQGNQKYGYGVVTPWEVLLSIDELE